MGVVQFFTAGTTFNANGVIKNVRFLQIDPLINVASPNTSGLFSAMLCMKTYSRKVADSYTQ
jgi:hypothetical protein